MSFQTGPSTRRPELDTGWIFKMAADCNRSIGRYYSVSLFSVVAFLRLLPFAPHYLITTTHSLAHITSGQVGGDKRGDFLIFRLAGFHFSLVGARHLLVRLSIGPLKTHFRRQIKRARNELYKSIIRQDMGFFDKNTPGDLTAALIA